MQKDFKAETATLTKMYDLVMNDESNPLKELQKPRRIQLMTILSWMWTTIFCASFGAWYLFDELVVGHVAVILGVAATAWTFDRSRRRND